MPYLTEDEEEKNKIETTTGAQQGGVVGGNVAGPKTQAGSGRYANLSKYLSANKEQAQKMGSDISAGVEQKGQAAQTGIERVAGAAPKVAELDVSKYLEAPESLSKEQIGEYQEFKKTGGYTGPKTIEDVSGYSEAMKGGEASKAAKALGTESGQIATLQEQYARPQYQKGQQTLDQLLLQNDPISKQRMADVSQRYGGLEDLLSGAITKTGGEIAAAQKKALGAQQDISSKEKASWESFLSPIKTRASEKTKEAQGMWDRISGDIQDAALNPETMEALGLRSGDALYDLGLSNFVTPDLSERTVEQVATPEERARYAALASLFEDATRKEITSGGSALAPVKFDKQAFETAQNKKRTELQNLYDQAAQSAMLDRDLPYVPGLPNKISDPKQITPYIDALRANRNARGQSVIDQARAGDLAHRSGETFENRIRDIVAAELAYKNLANPRRIIPAGMKDLPVEYQPGFNPKEV